MSADTNTVSALQEHSTPTDLQLWGRFPEDFKVATHREIIENFNDEDMRTQLTKLPSTELRAMRPHATRWINRAGTDEKQIIQRTRLLLTMDDVVIEKLARRLQMVQVQARGFEKDAMDSSIEVTSLTEKLAEGDQELEDQNRAHKSELENLTNNFLNLAAEKSAVDALCARHEASIVDIKVQLRLGHTATPIAGTPVPDPTVNTQSPLAHSPTFSSEDIKDLRKSARDAVTVYNDEQDVGSIKTFIRNMEAYFMSTNFSDEQRMRYAETKFGPNHKLKLHAAIPDRANFFWSHWTGWITGLELYRRDSENAYEQLQATNQYNLRMDFATFFAHMCRINDRIDDHDHKERNFQLALMKAVDLRFRAKLREKYDEKQLDRKVTVLKREDFYDLALLCERHANVPATATPAKASAAPHTDQLPVVAAVQTESFAIMPDSYKTGPLSRDGWTWCKANNTCTFCRKAGHQIKDCTDPKLLPAEVYRARQVLRSHSLLSTPAHFVPHVGIKGEACRAPRVPVAEKDELCNVLVESVNICDESLSINSDIFHPECPHDGLLTAGAVLEISSSPLVLLSPATIPIEESTSNPLPDQNIKPVLSPLDLDERAFPEESLAIVDETAIPVWVTGRDEKLFDAFVSHTSSCDTPAVILDDTGCWGMCVSEKFVEAHQFPTRDAHSVVTIKLADGVHKINSTRECMLWVTIGNWKKQTAFAVIRTDYDIIFGLPFHNSITIFHEDWAQRIKKFRTRHGTDHTWYGRGHKRSHFHKQIMVAQLSEVTPRDALYSVTVTDPENLSDPYLDEIVAPYLNVIKPLGQTHCIESNTAPHQPTLPELLATMSPPLRKIIERYPTVFSDPPHTDQIPHRPEDMRIHLKNVTPIKQRPLSRTSQFEQEALKVFLADLLRLGRIRTSNSPYGANILFVRKGDGGLRLVTDYRAINADTVRDQTPLVSHAVLRERVRGAKIMSKLDLSNAFHMILVAEADRHKTAFKTEFGLYEYTVCPFGMANSPAVFISLMNRVFAGTDHCVIHYVDDILIFSDCVEDHLRHIEEVLRRLEEHQLYVKPSKCVFAVSSTTFCGVHINGQGVAIEDHAKTAMCSYPQITSFKEVQQFLGSVRFFAEFVPWLADIAHPLFALTKKDVMLKQKFDTTWNTMHQMAVRHIQFLLTSSSVLHFFDPSAITSLHSDASDFAIGGWISQHKDDTPEYVVTYWSRQLIPAERNYPVHEKEFLAMHQTILKHRFYLFGHPFSAFVDHRALEHLATQPQLRPRQIRWILDLQEFDFKTVYQTGESNTFADWLSRRPDYQHFQCPKCTAVNAIVVDHDHPTVPSDISNFLDDIRLEQADDEFCMTLDSWQELPKTIPFSKAGYFKSFSKIDGIWRYNNSAVVLPNRDDQIYFLERYHGSDASGHWGYKKTLDHIQRYVYWPSLIDDVRKFVNSCDVCQRHSAKLFVDGLLHSLQVPDARGHSIALDFVEFPADVSGPTHLLLITDRLTKFVMGSPCNKSATAKDVASILFHNWYLKGYGLPFSIVSDRDSRLAGDVWTEFCTLTGISQTMSTARHQQTDGQAEIAIRIVSTALAKVCNHKKSNWVAKLPLILFSYNNSLHSVTGFSPFYLMHAFQPQTFPALADHSNSLAKMYESFGADLEKAHWHIAAQHDKSANTYNRSRRQAVQYSVGDWVLLSRDGIKWAPDNAKHSQKLLAPWLGPFQVSHIDRELNNISLTLPPTMHCHPVFHIRVLKPYVTPTTDFPHRPTPDNPPPILTEDGFTEFEVESILDHKTMKSGKRKFLVHWKGYDASHDSWEPESSLDNASTTLLQYCATNRVNPPDLR
jgi:hypothetical protein